MVLETGCAYGAGRLMPAQQDPTAAARIGQVIWLLFCIGLCVLVAVFTWIPEYLILFCVGKGGWL